MRMSSAAPRRHRGRGMSLAMQVTIAGVALGLLVAVIFGLMAQTIDQQRDAARDASRTSRYIAAANLLERYLIDAETSQRGYIITRQQRFLEPLTRAQREIPLTIARLRALSVGDDVARERAERVATGIDAYLRDWI